MAPKLIICMNICMSCSKNICYSSGSILQIYIVHMCITNHPIRGLGGFQHLNYGPYNYKWLLNINLHLHFVMFHDLEGRNHYQPENIHASVISKRYRSEEYVIQYVLCIVYINIFTKTSHIYIFLPIENRKLLCIFIMISFGSNYTDRQIDRWIV